jgi:hypothetical protein
LVQDQYGGQEIHKLHGIEAHRVKIAFSGHSARLDDNAVSLTHAIVYCS